VRDGKAGASEALAHFASGLAYERLPSRVIEHLKLCVLDGLGCALFATTLPWSRILDAYVAGMGGREESTSWLSGARVPAANAALVNGTLVHGFELDDLHRASILHPGSVALPAALAIAEADPELTGRDLMTALAAGFEVGIRAGLSLGTSHLLRGFHPTGTSGTVGAAAAAGRALGLDAPTMAHAISIAATQAAGLMAAQYESMVKRMHAGRAAQAGVTGARLASAGFTGIDQVFEADYGGYCATLSDEPDPGALTRGLGEDFETERVGFKIYACCGSCHTTVEAIRRLRAKHTLEAGAVRRVTVHATRATQLHVGWPYQPKGVTAAQMNLPYCAAVTLIDGEAFVEQFTEARTRDPRVIGLAKHVDVRQAPEFDALGPEGRHRVRVEVALRNGTTIEETVGHAKGSAADPLSRDEVIDKYRRLAVPVLGATGAQGLLDAVLGLERTDSAAALTGLLARPSPRPGPGP
jgi:2-methylcitrate dehydratase PrpD